MALRRPKTMPLLLPDRSVAEFDLRTLRFREVNADPSEHTTLESEPEGGVVPRISNDQPGWLTRPSTGGVELDLRALQSRLCCPDIPFAEAFARRSGNEPRYTQRWIRCWLDITILASLYDFDGHGHGGMFSSSHRTYEFLDGGMTRHQGYGIGDATWTVVDGFEALRAICLFFGVVQPRSLKGEPPRRSLAAILERLTTDVKLAYSPVPPKRP